MFAGMTAFYLLRPPAGQRPFDELFPGPSDLPIVMQARP